ncbi:MAG: hypothetical protein ABJA98_04050 [Acidobacteriota bacterium]
MEFSATDEAQRDAYTDSQTPTDVLIRQGALNMPCKTDGTETFHFQQGELLTLIVEALRVSAQRRTGLAWCSLWPLWFQRLCVVAITICPPCALRRFTSSETA